MKMSRGILNFLASVGMGHHFDMFITRGFDEESDIPHLSVTDLRSIGIHDSTEVLTILKAAMSYKQSPEHELFSWLRNNGLAHYWEGFSQSQLTDLTQVAQLNLPDEDLYDELEITLPGHKRRLERAVCALRKRQRRSSLSDVDVVTEGWWGYPEYLHNAKYPFLCVQATIRSTAQSTAPVRCMDFMVDSGSDVSTLRDDVIQTLQLESIRTVKSCGVYGSQRTTMYRAHLAIGDTQLEIEVISSSYDSLGSRVLRHFRHRIDSSRHTWLRGSRPIPPLSISDPAESSRRPASTATSGPPETVSVLSNTNTSGMAAGGNIAYNNNNPGEREDVLGYSGTSDKDGLGSDQVSHNPFPSYQHDHGYFRSSGGGGGGLSKTRDNHAVTDSRSNVSAMTSTSQQNRSASTRDSEGSSDGLAYRPDNRQEQGYVICTNGVVKITRSAGAGHGQVMFGSALSHTAVSRERSGDAEHFTNTSETRGDSLTSTVQSAASPLRIDQSGTGHAPDPSPPSKPGKS